MTFKTIYAFALSLLTISTIQAEQLNSVECFDLRNMKDKSFSKKIELENMARIDASLKRLNESLKGNKDDPHGARETQKEAKSIKDQQIAEEERYRALVALYEAENCATYFETLNKLLEEKRLLYKTN